MRQLRLDFVIRSSERVETAGARSLRATALLGLAIVLGAVALSSCGGGSNQHRSGGHGSGKASSSGSGKASSSGSAAPVRQPIRVVDDFADGAQGPEHLRVAIYDLRRTGAFLTLDFGITCLSSTCDTELDFGPPPPEASIDLNTPDGTTLVDPSANKRYFPVTDAQRRPDCSQLSPQLTDQSLHLAYVTFPAPPASVSSLDVLFSYGGAQVSAVPISTSAAPAPAEVGPGAQAATPAPFSQPPSGSTAGLRLLVENLILTTGNKSGSDAESSGRATITLSSDVLFHFAKSNLTPIAQGILASVAARIKARARGVVQVTGNTDSIGTDSVNIPLSQARARSVIAALKPGTAGAPISFQAAGDGANNPVAPNANADGSDNPAGRALNRRVTITFNAKTNAPPTPPPAPAPAPPTGAASTTRTLAYRTQLDPQDVSNYQLTVDRIFRSGDLAVLQLTVGCTSATAIGQTSSSCASELDFAGTLTAPPIALNVAAKNSNLIYQTANTLSGIYLRDAGGTDYTPVHDTDKIPLTATVLNLHAGSGYPVWVYFPAPAPSVSSVTVLLPGGKQGINQVPITG